VSRGDSAYLRGLLAGSGILLDAPTAVAVAALAERPPAEPDRELIREILVDRGAPAHSLDWLTKSCLSVRDAEDYRAPAIDAWCVDCGGPQPTDAAGCLTCRERTA
jgi:hypothetical protein